MRILFLDDCPVRRHEFLSRLPHAYIVETAQQAIDRLGNQEWDVVCLDHDLRQDKLCVPPNHSDGCGLEVVRYLLACPAAVGRVIVHSYNRPAAEEMVAWLEHYRAEWIPFGPSLFAAIDERPPD